MKPAFLGNEIEGTQKILIIEEDKITLKQMKNLRSALTQNYFKGDKTINYSNMTGVQFKPATKYILGYIQFETASTYASDNFNSENSWTFDMSYNELAQKIVDYVNERINSKLTGGTIVQQLSPADELLKFKQLLDSGIITQEEFDQKKKELLGL